MSRFTGYINEKVSKQEIDEMLASKDINIGAEFEFKVNNRAMKPIEDEYRDLYIASEEYEDEHSAWENIDYDWRQEEAEERKKAQETDDPEEYMDRWYDENEQPVEPEPPIDYVSRYDRDRDYVTYEDVEKYVRYYMSTHSKLKKYENDNNWEFKEDTSLEDYGIEIATTPMELGDFLEACDSMFAMINDIGYTDKECGFHIGISLKKGMDEVDPVKVALFVDEGYIWKMFSSRKASIYAKSMQQEIKRVMYNNKWGSKLQDNIVQIDRVKRMLKTTDIKLSNFTGEHYHGVNVTHLEDDNKYIEFRYVGGADYQNKLPEIKKIIAHYIYALKLSRDPEFKKKEYILKCARILAKIETWVTMKSLEVLEANVEFEKAKIETTDTTQTDYIVKNQFKLIKADEVAIKNLKRRLQYLPKLNDEELAFMRSL